MHSSVILLYWYHIKAKHALSEISSMLEFTAEEVNKFETRLEEGYDIPDPEYWLGTHMQSTLTRIPPCASFFQSHCSL